MSESDTLLPPPRHLCHGCGGSCLGVNVRVFDDEPQRIELMAAALDVSDPIVDGVLRQDDGVCAFLDGGARCRIHAEFGEAAKPLICRQFPLVVLGTARGHRAGIDPGCYHAWRSWRTAAEVQPDHPVAVNQREVPPPEEAQEATLLSLLRAAPSPRAALDRLTSPGVEQRWAEHVRSLDLATLARRCPGPMAAFHIVRILRPTDGPAAWPELTPEVEAWTLHAARSFVALREADAQLRSYGSLLLFLLGALSAAWCDPAEEPFGVGLAAWARGLRLPAFWTTLVQRPEVLMALAGAPPGAGVS